MSSARYVSMRRSIHTYSIPTCTHLVLCSILKKPFWHPSSKQTTVSGSHRDIIHIKHTHTYRRLGCCEIAVAHSDSICFPLFRFDDVQWFVIVQLEEKECIQSLLLPTFKWLEPHCKPSVCVFFLLYVAWWLHNNRKYLTGNAAGWWLRQHERERIGWVG